MAWGVYMAIYLQKYTSELNSMLSYQEYIHKLMRQQARWWAYDKQFRIDKEHARCSWDTIRPDLERDAYMPSNFRGTGAYQKGTPSNRNAPTNVIPKGFCYDFQGEMQL